MVAGDIELEGHGGPAGSKGGRGAFCGGRAVDVGHLAFLGDQVLLALFLEEQLLVVLALLALELELLLDALIMVDLVAGGLGRRGTGEGKVAGRGAAMEVLDGAEMDLGFVDDHAVAMAGLEMRGIGGAAQRVVLGGRGGVLLSGGADVVVMAVEGRAMVEVGACAGVDV